MTEITLTLSRAEAEALLERLHRTASPVDDDPLTDFAYGLERSLDEQREG